MKHNYSYVDQFLITFSCYVNMMYHNAQIP